MRAGPLRDVWTAVQPDISTLRPMIAQGDKLLGGRHRRPAHARARARSPWPRSSARSCAATPTGAAAGAVPRHLLAPGDLGLARRDPRLPGRPDRDLAGPRRGPPAGPGRVRRPRGPRARPRLAAARRRRGRRRPRPRRPAARGGRRVVPAQPAVARRPARGPTSTSSRAARTSRPPARRSTARSARRSSTAAPASSTRATGGPSTASCAPRPSRSCGELDELGPDDADPATPTSILGRWSSSSPSCRSSSASS